MKHLLFAAPVLVSLLAFVGPSSSGIEWDHTYEDALARAAAEKKVVFIAVNMDGERANEEMVKKTYKEKRIVELSGSTINLIASNDTHTKGDGPCKRFGLVTCPEHRRIDISVRGKVLKPDEEGYVIAPQHVWLGPDAKVILSVPYQVSDAELEWCFFTALRAVDPNFAWRLSAGARAPRMLVMGDVVKTAGMGQLGSAPPTREEALQLLDELKRGSGFGGGGGQGGQGGPGAGWAERVAKVRRLAQADEPEAREYLLTYLRAASGRGFGGGGGGRGGGGGGAGGQGGQDEGPQAPDRRALLLRWIGEASPQSYWEVCIEFISAGEDSLRKEAIVALEQIAAPESIKQIRAAVGKEKDPAIRKNLFRALGTAGSTDSNARKMLLKQAKDKRNDLWRANSLLALGFLAPEDDVHEFLTEALAGQEENDLDAVILAVAITRDKKWIEPLKAKQEDQKLSETQRELLKRAIGVLEGEPLSSIAADVQRVGSDEIPRRRLFGLTGPEGGPGGGREERGGGGGDEGGGEGGGEDGSDGG